jgi:glycosyltransferase involved in cell wall biosynthesis
MSAIDIVVPCYNYGRFLRCCVESVLEQSHRALRVLIVDDASDDETQDVACQLAERDSRVSVRRHAENRGHIATYNEGIEWAASEYMLLLDADDFLLPGALDRAIAALDANQDVGLAWGAAISYRSGDPSPEPIPDATGVEANVLDANAFILSLEYGNCVPQSAAIVRTDVQKRLGGYRSELPHAGDLEMWLRFTLYSKVIELKCPQCIYRRHQSNMSLGYSRESDLEQCKLAFRVHYQEIRQRLPDGAALEQSIRFRLALKCLFLAKVAFREGRKAACRKLLRHALDEIA